MCSSMNDKGKKIVFSIERDIFLLEAAININPFQLGDSKWADIVHAIEAKYMVKVSQRTLKDRLKLLLEKYKKEELTSKTGTEEQRTKRGILLEEIILIQETEFRSINLFRGADETDENFENEVVADEIVQPSASRKPSRHAKREEKIQADEERDNILNSAYPEAPPDARSTRKKRTKSALEEDLIAEKCKQDMDLEEKRFKLEEKVKTAEIENEKRRLEIELIREQRLADENTQRNKFYETIMKSLELMQKFSNKLA